MDDGPKMDQLVEDNDVLLFLGTAKGIYRFKGNKSRQHWDALDRTLHEHDISALNWDKRTPETVLAATAAGKLFISRNKGETWEPSQLEFPGQKIWTITPDPHAPAGAFYLGVDGGHLYYCQDNGATCHEVRGLRELPHVDAWFGPFGPAIFHSILPVASQPGLIYLGLSVVGVLASQDGGLNWQDVTSNIPRVTEDPNEPQLADVHKLAVHPQNPSRLYATTHYGTFRSDNGSQSWESIGAGIPLSMTRPLALHPTDPNTVFVIAHDDGSDTDLPMIRGPLVVYRSRNAGQNWEALGQGLPQQVECAVLREALFADEGQPCSLYLGTNKGQVFASLDEGDNWQLAAEVEASVRVVRV